MAKRLGIDAGGGTESEVADTEYDVLQRHHHFMRAAVHEGLKRNQFAFLK